MTRDGIELNANLCPWLRFCVGVAILTLAVTPLVWVVLSALKP